MRTRPSSLIAITIKLFLNVRETNLANRVFFVIIVIFWLESKIGRPLSDPVVIVPVVDYNHVLPGCFFAC